jgi:GNAT superfamily N-acetyltransferase
VNAPIQIREALPAEASRLTRLAMRSKAYWGYSDAFMAACRRELTVHPRDLLRGDRRCNLATREGKIVGFYALERLPDGDFELEALFVEPGHIGSGIGRMLMDHAIETATREGATQLIVQGDPNAAAFYAAAGGTRIGERASGSIPGRFLPVYSISLAGSGNVPSPGQPSTKEEP